MNMMRKLPVLAAALAAATLGAGGMIPSAGIATAHAAVRHVTASAVAGAVPASATALTATTAGMIGQPSSAAIPSCPSGNLCTFQDANFRGTRWNFGYNNRPHAKWFYVGNGANDKISSFINNRAWTSYFDKDCPAGHQGAHTDGRTLNMNLAGNRWPNGTTVNNSISAIALGTNSGVHVPAHWHHRGGC